MKQSEKAYLCCDESTDGLVFGVVSTVGSTVVDLECRSETRCLILKNRLLSLVFGAATCVSVALDSRRGKINVDEGVVSVAEPSACCSDFSWLALSWLSFSKYRAEANSVM